MDRRTKTGRTVIQRIAPVVLVGMLGIGAAACGSSGSSKVQNNPGGQAPTPTTGTPTTQGGSSSGGAGF